MVEIAERAVDRRLARPDRESVPPEAVRAAAATGRRAAGQRLARPPLLVLLSGAIVLGFVLFDAPAAVRAVPVLTYLAVVPGLACVRLVRLRDRLTELIVAVALSLALGILVAEVLLQLGWWSPAWGLAVLVVIASLAASVELGRDRGWTVRLPSPRRRW
ncbi:hypothetical protein SAMN05444365_104172 [Micromonospora pattaloongensis]|uniref:Uncharacterized protein n=1 Tax=Micromonospora pattaloongensis TaxID=405436 RepID=A0A1H3NWR6_9ACTN|nr:hypothetical protein [Micromonospora pattaloongensis]SDY92609.1 hypothetical protein SAMN05444365_104172 [Micromonospora pattaloongensis]